MVEDEELSDDEEYPEDDDQDYEDEDTDDDEEEDGEPEPPLAKDIDSSRVAAFEKTEEQLESFFQEFSLLSKKSPDGPLNVFKVKMLNHTIANANGYLEGDYRPFPGFEEFDSDDLPTASDAVMIISQYLRGMNTYRADHSYGANYRYYWHTSDGSEIAARGPKDFDK